VAHAFAVKEHIGLGGDADVVNFFCGHGVRMGRNCKTVDFR
jgi:hypothetical protein